MTNKDYLQIAKLHLNASDDHYDHEDRYVGPDTTRAAQAQAAALIAMIERLDDLIGELQNLAHYYSLVH